MILMDDEIARTIPKLYAQDKLGDDAIVYVKYFDPCSNWTWYVTEYDGKDEFFGFVVGFENELGYFSLSELQRIKGRLGLGIERDLYFTPTKLKAIKKEHGEFFEDEELSRTSLSVSNEVEENVQKVTEHVDEKVSSDEVTSLFQDLFECSISAAKKLSTDNSKSPFSVFKFNNSSTMVLVNKNFIKEEGQ